MFSDNVFLIEWGYECTKFTKGDVKIKCETVINELGVSEDVVLVRDGHRRLIVCNSENTQLLEHVMQNQVREGQARETYDCAVEKDLSP